MKNKYNVDDAINSTFLLMQNMKDYGLSSPISTETYAYYARRADTLLHDKLKAEEKPSSEIIEKINFARREYHAAKAQLKAYGA
ncbi:MAG: hypothetical protein LBD94_03415 [Rickettsiales bacterium]|jgi:hypothetical protein|nr:hypothetical protein [Rickettsiales bacterium]